MYISSSKRGADVARLSLFGSGLVLLVLTEILSHHRITAQRSDAEWVTHAHEVIEGIDAVRARLLSAQFFRRTYSLTSEPRHREALKMAVPEIHAAAAKLQGLTRDPRQQERLRLLAPLLDRRIEHMVRAIENPIDLAREPQIIREADALTLEVFRALDEFESEERKILVDRETDAKVSAQATVAVSTVGGGVGLAVLLLGLGLFIRENRVRRFAEEAVRRVNGELEAANREIASTAAKVHAFFESSLDLAAVADMDGTFKKLNPSWERVLGWPQAELLSHPWLDFVHPDDRANTIGEAEKLAQGAPVLHFENRYRCKNGSYRWLSWSVPAPVPGSSTLYALARDVTELKAHEEKLRALNAKLEEANQELEAFSYSVSHDLRAPLRHANGFVELLEKHAVGALDGKARHYLHTISDATRKMGRLIDDLLAFSRTGRSQMRPIRVSMARLVEEVWGELGTEAEGRRIAWDLKPLPDATGDFMLLRQVWVNLLSNAIKYTKNREDARVEVGSLSMNGQGTVFYVRDNGAGFDMRYADKLFGVFQRLHGTQEFEGTGIGLANAKRIVTRHGGKIWAEGKVGEGATFSFTIPLAGEERR
ncbi:MAG TPA: ATP-binding protein [Planctomycetota bacterium]|nr:ATP-binding protein [Planctomycetota bacterium]